MADVQGLIEKANDLAASCLRDGHVDVANTLDALAAALEDAGKEKQRLRAEVCWWAGEGQTQRPEVLEWQRLADKANPSDEDEERMGVIARQFHIEHEECPELRERIAYLDADLARLRKEVERVHRLPCQKCITALDEMLKLDARIAELERLAKKSYDLLDKIDEARLDTSIGVGWLIDELDAALQQKEPSDG